VSISAVSTEYVSSFAPFTVRRRVRFGECDPAGVVYTVRFSDYAVSAMELFLAELLQARRAQQAEIYGVDMPLKALRFTFSRALRCDDEFAMAVTIGDIRERTFDLNITARSDAGAELFEAVLSPICIHPSGERRSVLIPPAMRERFADYQMSRAITR
jgi:acyl-CoA thioester hydrolase